MSEIHTSSSIHKTLVYGNTRLIGNVGIGDIKPISKLSVGGKISITSESLTPDAPVDGKGYLYTKDDGKIYWRSYDIDETDLTGGGGGSGIVNNRIDGDLTIGDDDSDLLVVNSSTTFSNIISGSINGNAATVTDGVYTTIINAKGDLIVGTSNNTITQLGVGTNDQVLTADSSEASGIKWTTVSGGSGIVNNRIDGDLTIGEDSSDSLVINSSTTFSNIISGSIDGITINTINTALGVDALVSVTSGHSNVASGYRSLKLNLTGHSNVALGYESLYTTRVGHSNTASGYKSLYANINGNENVASGYESLRYNQSGHSNVALGYQSLHQNTSGYYNVASGYESLRQNTSGRNNVALGYQSLRSNTTGMSNVASGYKSLYANTTGASNVASGYHSLRFNTNGNYNVASGYQSLYRNTTGHSNVAFGYESLMTHTTATNNTATGFRSLKLNLTGFGNTASGNQSLYNNTTGHRNVASGYDCLYNNTTGYYNTALGGESLYGNINGFGNTGIGWQAGKSITSGDYNVCIGYGTNVPTAAGNKQLLIGTFGVTWISGDLSGKVGIGGTTDSSAKLYVNGNIIATGTIATSSDDRIKYNEQNINGTTALNVINQLNPQKYEKIIEKPHNASGTWIPTDSEWAATERDATIDETDEQGNEISKPKWKWDNEIGLIAQDIKLISELQNSVRGQEVDENGKQTPLALNYNNIFSYHIAATKQLTTELNAEKVKITTLETELAVIKEHLGL